MGACPCKGCTDREVGCHSKCDKYATWRQEQDCITKKKKLQKIYEVHPYDFLGTSPPPGKHIEKRKKRWGGH